MIGFLKWLILNYETYKMSIHKDRDGSLFIQNYETCINAGFSNEQMIALMNLIESVRK